MRNLFCIGRVFLNPFHQDRSEKIQFMISEFPAFRDSVPFPETGTAADPGCMLGNKTGMSPHGCLFSIMFRFCGDKTLQQKLTALMFHFRHSPFRYDFQFFFFQTEPGTESGSGKPYFQLFPLFFDLHGLLLITWRNYTSGMKNFQGVLIKEQRYVPKTIDRSCSHPSVPDDMPERLVFPA